MFLEKWDRTKEPAFLHIINLQIIATTSTVTITAITVTIVIAIIIILLSTYHIILWIYGYKIRKYTKVVTIITRHISNTVITVPATHVCVSVLLYVRQEDRHTLLVKHFGQL